MNHCTINPLAGCAVCFVALLLSLICFIGNVQSYIEKENVSHHDKIAKLLQWRINENIQKPISNKQSMNNKEIQAMAELPISELISLPKETIKKLTWFDILLLVIAWASGVFFSKFAEVLVKGLKI